MFKSNFIFDFIKSYIDEFGNKILVYKVIDTNSGLSEVVEGIHEYKLKRKAIKKIEKQLKSQERDSRLK